MYRFLEHRLAQRVLECLQRRHPGVSLPGVVVEQPPNVELGDFAIPMFPFAKPLRSAPLKIAEGIRNEIGPIEGIAEMAGGSSRLSERQDRSRLDGCRHLLPMQKPAAKSRMEKFWSSTPALIPNKAAHIGHLRNAILGDTFVRLLQ